MIFALDVCFSGPTVSSLGVGIVVRSRLQVMTLAGKYAAPILLPQRTNKLWSGSPVSFRS